MIIVKIFQGPGNQMFQYAYGLAASKRVGTDLKLDISWFDHYSYHREYILDRFNISAPVATPEEIQYIKSCDGANFFEYRYNLLRDKLAPAHKKAIVTENLSEFNPKLKFPYKQSYIEGYFTSEQFFSDYESLIRKQLSFKGDPNEKNAKLKEQMQSCNSVALSIRRGDFLKYKYHNVCSIDYYERTIKYLSEKVNDLHFFVFSDELDWVKKNLPLSAHKVTFMDYNQPDYMTDMRMMTFCKYHIIANSTFSWWGAWLAEDKKEVICPQYWLHPDKRVHAEGFDGKWAEFSHVLPENWTKIPNLEEGDRLMS